MSKSIKDRVLELGARIAKGLDRGDPVMNAKAEVVSKLVQDGKITPNGARRVVDLEDLSEGGDRHYRLTLNQESRPAKPVEGDTWFRPSCQSWYRWNGSHWIRILPEIPKSVQPTRADVVQASETLSDIRKSADEAVARIDAWLTANPTGPEVK